MCRCHVFRTVTRKALRESKKEGRVTFQLIASSFGYGDGNVSILLESFHRRIREMHSTSEFAMIVLSKCVLNCKHVSTTFFSDIPYSHSISVTISAMPWSGKGRAYAATGGGITWPGREREIYIYIYM